MTSFFVPTHLLAKANFCGCVIVYLVNIMFSSRFQCMSPYEVMFVSPHVRLSLCFCCTFIVLLAPIVDSYQVRIFDAFILDTPSVINYHAF
jgi:hypothetical protein